MQTPCPECSLRTAPNCSKIQKMSMTSQLSRHDVIGKCFWRGSVSLVKFSYCSKFHVNVVTGSGILTIFFYKGLTRSPEIGNTPVWVFPNFGRLGRVMDTKFGTNISNRISLNDAKSQGYSFYCFWVIKGKPTEGGNITSHPTQIRVNLLLIGHSSETRQLRHLSKHVFWIA